MKIRHAVPYDSARSNAYPSFGDQLDAILELAQALRDNGFPLPPKAAAWVAQCERVKAQHPKNGLHSKPVGNNEDQ